MARKPTGDELAARAQARQETDKPAEIHPVSQTLMDGLGTDAKFNGAGFHIKALPIKHQKRVQEGLWKAWPTVLIMAARADLYGHGINLDAMTELYNIRIKQSMLLQFQQAKAEWDAKALAATEGFDEAPPTMPKFEDYPAEWVQAELLDVNERLVAESEGTPIEEGGMRLIDDIATSIWPIVAETPNLTAESLSGVLEEYFTVEDLVDLLRAILRAYGTHPGCMADRFVMR